MTRLDPDLTYYAVVNPGGPVWGVGRTEEDAWDDAAGWYPDDEGPRLYPDGETLRRANEASAGTDTPLNLWCVPCSKAAAELILAEGYYGDRIAVMGGDPNAGGTITVLTWDEVEADWRDYGEED